MTLSWQGNPTDDGLTLAERGGLRGKIKRSGPLQGVPAGLARLPGAPDETADAFAREMAAKTDAYLNVTEAMVDRVERTMGGAHPEATIGARPYSGREMLEDIGSRWNEGIANVKGALHRTMGTGQGALTAMITTPWDVVGGLGAAANLEGRLVHSAIDRDKGAAVEAFKQFPEDFERIRGYLPGAKSFVEPLEAQTLENQRAAGLGPLAIVGSAMLAPTPMGVVKGAGRGALTAGDPRAFRTALRDPETGQVFAHESGVHADIIREMEDGAFGAEGQEAAVRIVDDLEGRARADEEISGFIDEEGNFYTRDEAGEAAGVFGSDGWGVTAEDMLESQEILEAEAKKIIKGQPVKPSKTNPAPKAMTDLPLRADDMTLEQAIEYARSGNHLKYADKAKTKFVGGPPKVGNPRQLRRMRSKYDDLVERGIRGAKWYEGSFESIQRVTRSDEDAALMGRELGLMSNQAQPQPNYGWMVEGHNAAVGGDPSRTILHTGPQWEKMQALNRGETAGILSLKTEPFSQHMGPYRRSMTHPVNDMWQARAFGYKTDAPSLSQHRFMDAEGVLAMERANARALGGRTDWTVGEIQAAAWVAKNAEWIAKDRKIPFEEALELAGRSFGDFTERHRGWATWESTPGARGHLTEVKEGDEALRKRYHDDPRSSWRDEQGRDTLTDAARLRSERVVDAQGVFEPHTGPREVNPADATPVQLGLVPEVSDVKGVTKGRGKTVAPVDQAIMNKVEAVRAYVDGQNMGAWHKDIPVGPGGATPGQATGFTIEHGQDLTPEQFESLLRIADEFGFSGGSGMMSNRGKSTVMSEWGPRGGLRQDLPRMRGALEEAGVPVGPGEGGLYTSRVDMGSADFEAAWDAPEGSGAVTRQLFEILDGPDAPEVLKHLDADPTIRRKILDRMERDAEMAIDMGYATRADLQNARKILGEEGFEGLRRALESGAVLPAIALPALLTLMHGAQQEEPDVAA